MKRVGKGLMVLLVLLATLWVAGRLLLEVQLPDRSERRSAFPDPMPLGVSLRAAFEALPADGRGAGRVQVLEDNAQAWVERWRLLASAKKRIDVSYFILKQDVFGLAFLGHLLQKAREGVIVRIILDGMGTEMSRDLRGNDYLDALVSSENIVVRMYRPLRYRILDAFLTLHPAAFFASDHDKILLADDTRAITGGRNISREYFAPHPNDPTAFYDLDVQLSGAHIGAALRTSFEVQYDSGEAHEIRRDRVDIRDATSELLLAYQAMDAWLRNAPLPDVLTDATSSPPSWLSELQALTDLRGAMNVPAGSAQSAELQLLDSYTRLAEVDDPITRSLIRLVRSAERELFIQSPYLVLPKEGIDVLQEAAERGVRITVVTNGPLSSDNALSQALLLDMWPEMLARVPTLRLFVADGRRNLHGKLAVIDRRLALIGTYNLDPISIALSSELMVAIWSPALARQLLQQRSVNSPRLVEYRIQRNPDGAPARDAAGRVVVVFGAAAHTELPSAVRFYQPVVRWLRWLPVWPLTSEQRVLPTQ